MKTKTVPIIIAILIPLVSITVAILLIFLKKSSVSNEASFPYDSYVQNYENLAGNNYLIRAEFELQLAVINGVGRVITLKDSLSGKKLAVLVPDSLNSNIMTRQRYEVNVTVNSDGAIVVNDMKKY